MCSSRACLHTAFAAISVHSTRNIQMLSAVRTPVLFLSLFLLLEGGGGLRRRAPQMTSERITGGP